MQENWEHITWSQTKSANRKIISCTFSVENNADTGTSVILIGCKQSHWNSWLVIFLVIMNYANDTI